MSDTSDMIDGAEFPEDDLLAAELVLNLLEGEQLSDTRARFAIDPAFAALVSGWQERLISMTDSIDPVVPPRRAKKRLLKHMFSAPRVPLAERLWVWKGLAFAAIALAAYMGIQQLGPEVPQSSGTVYATQLMGDAVPLQVLAVVHPDRGDITLSRLAGSEQAGRAFELWAILPDQAPVSLGVLTQSNKMRIELPDKLRGRVAEITLAISDEPFGGSPTGAPTGDVLAAAAVIEL